MRRDMYPLRNPVSHGDEREKNGDRYRRYLAPRSGLASQHFGFRTRYDSRGGSARFRSGGRDYPGACTGRSPADIRRAVPTPGTVPSPYEEIFLRRGVVSERSAVYVSTETKRRLTEVVRRLGWSSISLTTYVENILSHHLELFRGEINRLYRQKNNRDLL